MGQKVNAVLACILRQSWFKSPVERMGEEPISPDMTAFFASHYASSILKVACIKIGP